VKDLLLALPRLGRMLISLAGDRDVPTAAKVVLAAMAVYLVSPIDLIPDFIPFLGYLDDVIRPLVLRYWPGSADSLERIAAVARRLARWVPSRVKARIFGSSPLPPRGSGPGEGAR
jgi:uncharacterized membrane protein YkvA (DUF1232 family)